MGQAVVALQPMGMEHLDAVAKLENAYQPRPWSKGMFVDELAADNRIYLVAETDRIVGFGGVMVIDDEAHVTNLLVAEAERGRGVGHRLLLELVSSAIGSGARHLTLEVRKDNTAALRLYGRFGMAPVGVRPRYYGDEDALILWAHDIDRPGYLEGLS